jgi:hypothetical protein
MNDVRDAYMRIVASQPAGDRPQLSLAFAQAGIFITR